MKSEAYLNEIRKSAGLARAVLKKITVDGHTALFQLATDVNYTADDVAYAKNVSQKYVPEGFTADARVIKSVPDAEGVRRAVTDFLRTKFPAAAAFVSPQDVEVIRDERGGRFFISADAEECRMFETGNVLDALSAELQRQFCGAWFGNVRIEEKKKGDIEREELPPPEMELAPRSFPIVSYEAIDGAAPRIARYIADVNGEEQGLTVCGRVTFVQEKETSGGKPYFTFTVADGSGTMRTAYFTKKATLEKVRAIKPGDSICLTGDNELFGSSLSFRAKAVDFGAPPEGYVFEERPSRPVPARYQTVFPEPVSDFVQSAMFGETPLPEEVTKETFVVFDLETTGLNNSPATGAMDRIIEVGAVKIADGKICEKFSSFVSCPVKLSQEIVNLTGIDDEMLVGAPAIKDVIADFFKFCDGCILVGHNVQFDYRFIRYYGEQEGYIFAQKQYDTVAFAQQVLHLSNYKLNTVADHYGFTFNHHRAFDDAYVTAKIFLQLSRDLGGLPVR